MRCTLVGISLALTLAFAAGAVELVGPPAPDEMTLQTGIPAIVALHAETATSIDLLLAGREMNDELQQQVQELKFQEELKRLRILADHCRTQGNEPEALLAEQELERLQNPQPIKHQPVSREEVGIIARTTSAPVAVAAPSSEEVTQ